MTITSDWHIHSRNSCDGANMTVADLIAQAGRAGILDFSLTDHLHTPFNLPDIAASRAEFMAAQPSNRFHFGVEASCVCQRELDEVRKGEPFAEPPIYGVRALRTPTAPLAIGLTGEDIERFQIEYVVGGAHWPMNVPREREAVIRDYHRQNMFLVTHPLVDIVAHPWWWKGHWKDARNNYTAEPWFDDFRRIPASMHDEFAAAAVEHQTVVEINGEANLLNPRYPERFKKQYLEYLAALKSKGALLSFGSDCHRASYQVNLDVISGMLASVGITDKDLWRLSPRRPGQTAH